MAKKPRPKKRLFTGDRDYRSSFPQDVPVMSDDLMRAWGREEQPPEKPHSQETTMVDNLGREWTIETPCGKKKR